MKRCEGSHCKSDEEINAKISTTELIFIHNSHNFDPDSYLDEAVKWDLDFERLIMRHTQPKATILAA